MMEAVGGAKVLSISEPDFIFHALNIETEGRLTPEEQKKLLRAGFNVMCQNSNLSLQVRL